MGWYFIYINVSVSPYFGVSILVTTVLLPQGQGTIFYLEANPFIQCDNCLFNLMLIKAFELKFFRPTTFLHALLCNPFTEPPSFIFLRFFPFFRFRSDNVYHECFMYIYRKRKFHEVEVKRPLDINMNTMDENKNNEEIGERICTVDRRKDKGSKKPGSNAYPKETSPKQPDKERYGCIVK